MANVDQCLKEVAEKVRHFLADEGGYSNGYYTYVSGTIFVDKEGPLSWNTPKAKEELTAKGLESRAKVLYKSLQEILQKYEVDRVEIRYKDTGCRAMETEVVHVVETIQRVWLT